MKKLKIATAGSVDDGKSTLIGRLLYDCNAIAQDTLDKISEQSKRKGLDYLDFSLATDGLVAEREQGITIDVAHIYFNSLQRSYVIADSPGHKEYTRNMVTGASNADASILLIDARKGLVEQTWRHFYINQLLGVKHLIVAINKMDLVNYDEGVFSKIVMEFKEMVQEVEGGAQEIYFIPISALEGDNLTIRSSKTAWYKGRDLLNTLDTISLEKNTDEQMRFPVQTVIRPRTRDFPDYRAYAGKIYGGSINVGEEIMVLPSRTSSTIKAIHYFDKQASQAEHGDSISLELSDDLNVSRGDLIVAKQQLPQVGKQVKATICWMDKKKLQINGKYLLRHGANQMQVKINAIYKVQTNRNQESIEGEINLNDIGDIEIQTAKTLYYDSYETHKYLGSFILIDLQSNNTSGVGFIR